MNAATKKNAAWREALAEGSRRRWARLPKERKTTVNVYASDAQLLRELMQWPEVGRSPAMTLRALIQAARGSLWKMDREGKATPTASMFAPMMGMP